MDDGLQIERNLKRAQRDAEHLDRIAGQIRRLASTQYEESMRNLFEAWTGDNSRLFLQKEEQVRQDIRDTSMALKRAADEILFMAEKTYAAEMRAMEIARQRTPD